MIKVEPERKVLRLNKNSWHWKAYTVWGLWNYRKSDYARQPSNLCSYFWLTVGTLALMLVLAAALAFVVAIWAVLLVMATMKAPLTVAGTFVALALAAAIILFIRRQLKASRWRRDHSEPAPPKPPNLAWEYLKAKKKKYCPLIEWES